MNQIIFIIVLIVVFVIMLSNKSDLTNSNLNTNSSVSKPTDSFDNTGVFNYFYSFFMNPYPQPMNKFFSNDKIGTPNDK